MSDQISNEPIPINPDDQISLFGKAASVHTEKNWIKSSEAFDGKLEKVSKMTLDSPNGKKWADIVDEFRKSESSGAFSIFLNPGKKLVYGAAKITDKEGGYLGDIVAVGVPERFFEHENEYNLNDFAKMVYEVLEFCKEAEEEYPQYLKWRREIHENDNLKLKMLKSYRKVVPVYSVAPDDPNAPV